MNIDYQSIIPQNFSQHTRVWIYQSSRRFTPDEAVKITAHLNSFGAGWLSHGTAVKAFCTLLHDYFLVFMADEAEMTVSGCSIDSTVRFVKSLETSFDVTFFDRTTMAFLINGEVTLTPLNSLNSLFNSGTITADTLFFDNTIQYLPEFREKWLIPLASSWLGKRLNVNIQE